jgi:circadian clock protein KaiC
MRAAQEDREKAASLAREQDIERQERELTRQRAALEAQIAALRAEFEALEGEAKTIRIQDEARERTLIADRTAAATRRSADKTTNGSKARRSERSL